MSTDNKLIDDIKNLKLQCEILLDSSKPLLIPRLKEVLSDIISLYDFILAEPDNVDTANKCLDSASDKLTIASKLMYNN